MPWNAESFLLADESTDALIFSSLEQALGGPAEARLRVAVESGAGGRIDVGEEIAQSFGAGARIVGVEGLGDSHAGLTADGMIAYRATEGFAGVDALRLTVRDAAGALHEADIAVAATPSPMGAGRPDGEHYMLARDAEGWSVAEAGREHRMVYVSKTGSHGGDGLTPGSAMSVRAYENLLDTLLIDPGRPELGHRPASWHVLFERGHDYGAIAPRHVDGEDALHPFVVGAWGRGERPLFGGEMQFWSADRNVLVRDLEFAYSPETARTKPTTFEVGGIDVLGDGHQNLMFENLLIRPYNAGVRVQGAAEDVTFYRVMVVDAHRENPANGARDWKDASANRIQGLFANEASGLLIEDSLFDRNGWEPGYRPSGERDPEQPPNMFSHNLYLNRDLTDVTVRDNVISRGASFGAQVRPGGMVDGNLFFGNNAALNMLGGANDAHGQTGLLIDNVLTAPANKDAYKIGARGWGAQVVGDGQVVDLIAADDGTALGSGPDGVRDPLVTNELNGARYDAQGTTIFNWGSAPDALAHAGAVSPSTLRTVTLDRYAATTLGDGRDRLDLIDRLRDRDRGTWNDTAGAEEAVDWFRGGFGYLPRTAASGRAVTFESDERADGFRWDNRLNWSDDRAPVSGDAVRLDGHAVTYSGETLTLAGLDFGGGGALRVTQGLLGVAAGLTADALGGRVQLVEAGQFVFNGYGDADLLTLALDGGRAVNTGVMTGRMAATARAGELILAEGGDRFVIRPGSSLTVVGDDARVGFDGPSGEARLRLMGGELSFVFDGDGIATIGEFRSGRHGTAEPAVRSVVDLSGGRLSVDLSALDAGDAGRRFTLIDADVLNGGLDRLAVTLAGAPEGHEARLAWDAAAAALHLDLI